jgi:TonB family protein
MSVDPSHPMSAVWTNLEGHVVNGALPLHRCIASSDRSGVFITESAMHAPSAVTLKLVRVDPTFADAQLSRWAAAADLSHPHLIRIFEVGQCHVGELHCLYVLMEYADENLAQLLEQRALAEHEAHEMLVQTLSVLAYLHERELVQGQLKPSNILAVGDQLKLASDTVRAVGESTGGVNAESAYDAPESRDGRFSAAGDIWALGVTVCESLTRRQPSFPHGAVGDAELPSDLHPPFREIVTRCLSRNPRDRPDFAEIQAWLRGEHTMGAAAASMQPAATPSPPPTMSSAAEQPASPEHPVAQTAVVETMQEPQSASVVTAEPKADTASTLRLVIRAEIIREEAPQPVRQYLDRRALALVLGSVAALTLSWIGISALRTDSTAKPTASEGERAVESRLPAPAPMPSEAARVVSAEPPPQQATSSAETGSAEATSVESPVRDEPNKAPSRVNEVIPDVPQSALQTIRGTVRVSVRLTIGKDGTVLAATADDPGPSRYFERLAIEASKKWTFSPAETEAQRMVLVRFNFTREGTTARATPVQ